MTEDEFAASQSLRIVGVQPAARRADDLFGGLSQLEQVRAQVLAGDVAGSIHDPAPEAPSGG